MGAWWRAYRVDSLLFHLGGEHLGLLPDDAVLLMVGAGLADRLD